MLRKVYYHLKPFIPRRYQIMFRSELIRRKLNGVTHVWPIDPQSGAAPANWSGWPGNRKFALVLTHDVEQDPGQDKCYQVARMEQGMGFRSSFNLIPERYRVSPDLRHFLLRQGFEVGVHDFNHDGKLFSDYRTFSQRAPAINRYLKEWNACGFRAGAMHHNLEWIRELDVQYDCSTFDTDPFEPQPDSVGTIFPFLVQRGGGRAPYVEMPYTLPQDFTLFVLMKEPSTEIWKRKLDWIAERGGMALINTHPDYMCFSGELCGIEQYRAEIYEHFLNYVANNYDGEYWHALPRDIARFCKRTMVSDSEFGGRGGDLTARRYA
ncbi:MAG: hypothetical protein ACOCXC_01965 [Fibrobacterota bacterium]